MRSVEGLERQLSIFPSNGSHYMGRMPDWCSRRLLVPCKKSGLQGQEVSRSPEKPTAYLPEVTSNQPQDLGHLEGGGNLHLQQPASMCPPAGLAHLS